MLSNERIRRRFGMVRTAVMCKRSLEVLEVSGRQPHGHRIYICNQRKHAAALSGDWWLLGVNPTAHHIYWLTIPAAAAAVATN